MKDPGWIIFYSLLFTIVCSLRDAYGCSRREGSPVVKLQPQTNGFPQSGGMSVNTDRMEKILPSLPKGKGFDKIRRKKFQAMTKNLVLIGGNGPYVGQIAQHDIPTVSNQYEDGDVSTGFNKIVLKGSIKSSNNNNNKGGGRSIKGKNNKGSNPSQTTTPTEVDNSKPTGRAFVQLTASSTEDERTIHEDLDQLDQKDLKNSPIVIDVDSDDSMSSEEEDYSYEDYDESDEDEEDDDLPHPYAKKYYLPKDFRTGEVHYPSEI